MRDSAIVPGIVPVEVARLVAVLVGQNAVIGMRRADAHGAGARGGGIVGNAETHGLVALGALGDGLDIGHAERGLDQQFQADLLLALFILLDLGDQHVDGVDVLRHADLGDQDHVEPRAVLDHVNHVAIGEVGVETVDADHHGLGAPVDVVEALDDILAGLLLVVGRDRVLEIQKDNVGAAFGSLLEQRGVRPRHGKL